MIKSAIGYFSYTFLMLMICVSLHGQKDTLNFEHYKTLHARNLGPAGMSGRVTAIDVNLSNVQEIFIGTASGGVWKSENGGTNWTPIFDDQKILSIGSVKINQKNPNEIWVGTGEGNPRNSVNTGGGIYKSIDGGKTWTCMGLKNTKAIHRIIIHKENPQIVFAGVLGAIWGKSEDRGVYKTIDGGKSWEKVLYVNEETGVGEMVVDPTNPNKIIVGMWEFGRKPWFFNSGGDGSGMYISYDAGVNWSRKTDEDGLPKGILGRMGLAFSASKSNIVYALIEAKVNGLYKSSDGGENWKLVSEKNIGGRPFYYAEIYVDPKNENRIFNLHTYVTRSEDGGKSFESIADYGNGVHPDHHAFWIHPENPLFIIDGNDGGLNISRDGGDTWQFAGNIPVGQFYHVNVDNDFPYHVYGGLQDNGSWIGPAYVLKRGGIRNHDWQELSFGDGFDVVPNVKDSRYGYTMSQGGYVNYYDRLTGRSEFLRPVHPEGEFLRFNWNAPIAQDPFNDCGVYFGSQFLHKSLDCGRSWRIISPDLTTNDTTKQKQLESGGLTFDATQAENHTTILSIAPSPVDDNVIWVGTDDGNLQLTTDGGNSWNNVAKNVKGWPKGAWIPQIEVSKSNAGEAFVVVNDYRRNNYSAYVFHSKDYGKTWNRMVNDTHVSSFCLSIVQDPEVPELLFLGTDQGLYFSIDYGLHWQKWNDDFPSVQVADMKIQEREVDLVIGTFGRAIWIIDNYRALRALAKAKENFEDQLIAFENPIGYQTSSRSVDGVRFIAQGEYVGENRSMGGAKIQFWLDPALLKDKAEETSKDKLKENGNEEKKKKGSGKKKAKLQILNNLGDTIRTIERDAVAGLNQFYWRMDERGVQYPSLRERNRKGFYEPSGAKVLPGTYTAVISFQDLIDSSMIKVQSDPRVELDPEELARKKVMQEEYYDLVDQATRAFNLLKEAKKTVEFVDKLIPSMPDSLQKDIKKMNKAHKDSINTYLNLYTNTEKVKGIQRDPQLLSSQLYSVSSYLSSAWGVPGGNAENQFNNVKRQTLKTVEKINQYITNDWLVYREEIEAIDLQIFKDLEPVKD